MRKVSFTCFALIGVSQLNGMNAELQVDMNVEHFYFDPIIRHVFVSLHKTCHRPYP